ncbi:MAG: hypothetical protein Q7S19_01995 [bacterium]|nr:hypothetical protein [bacterium]
MVVFLWKRPPSHEATAGRRRFDLLIEASDNKTRRRNRPINSRNRKRSGRALPASKIRKECRAIEARRARADRDLKKLREKCSPHLNKKKKVDPVNGNITFKCPDCNYEETRRASDWLEWVVHIPPRRISGLF